jgi:hypothetical protein
MASLFNQNGELYDWFAPTSELNEAQMRILQERKWILRLAKSEINEFTLVIRNDDQDEGIRITNSDYGYYKLKKGAPNSDGEYEYQTLVDLLLDKLPICLNREVFNPFVVENSLN